ncbi:hypothetical protein Hte_007234 [Hypoxylon texense]
MLHSNWRLENFLRHGRTRRRTPAETGILSISQPTQPTQPIADVVFACDVGGDFEVPEVLPQDDLRLVRILVFNYTFPQENFPKILSKETVEDYKTKLLNGLEAMRRDAEVLLGWVKREKQYRNTIDRLYAIVFLDTPHYRAGLSEWATIFAKSNGIAKGRRLRELALLENDADRLAEMQTEFRDELVLSPEWAIMPFFTCMGIPTNHSGMVKLKDRNTPAYKTIVGQLDKWIEELKGGSADQTSVFQESIVSELPFSQGARPVESEEQLSKLETGLRLEAAQNFMWLERTPWLVKRRDSPLEYSTRREHGTAYEPSIAGLYLSSNMIPRNIPGITIQRIIFQTRAADQGWATFGGDGTFENSHTWFEASILRPLPPDTENTEENSRNVVGLEDILRDTWRDVGSSKEDLANQGWEFVQGEGGRISWKVCNNITARIEYRNYLVEWKKGSPTGINEEGKGNGDGFLELVEPGCIVVLWARAEEALWCNRVRAATVEIELRL